MKSIRSSCPAFSIGSRAVLHPKCILAFVSHTMGVYTLLCRLDEVSIGIKADNRFVVWNDVTAQDAVQHLPACPVAFWNGLLEQVDKGIPDLSTVLVQASFCTREGIVLD